MIKKFLSKSLVVLLAVLMVFSCLGTAVFAEEDNSSSEQATSSATKLQKIKELLDSKSYQEYRLLNENAPNGTSDILVNGADYNAEQTTAQVYTAKICGSEKDVLVIPATGDVTWNFNAPSAGNYNIEIKYCPIVSFDANGDGKAEITGNASTIERALLLDGFYPFKESRYIEMSRVWRSNPTGEVNDRGFMLDNDGSEIKSTMVEEPEWRIAQASDATGYITDSFLYYISEGSHTISLGEVQEPVAIESIRIYFDDTHTTYEEYLSSHASSPDNAAGSEITMIEAEQAKLTSSNIIYPIYDRSSAITSPQSAYNIYLNTIGGEKWETVGQWIRWDFEVPEDGFYTIAPRFKQSFSEGMYVTRELKIDGETPFEEARSLRFTYDDDWQLGALTDGVIDEATGEEREFKFYLTKGVHELEMQVSLGGMASILTDVETSLNNINDYYLRVLMLTGSDPDEYRDYQFSRLMPDVLKGMISESKRLYEISAQLEEINGTKGSDSVTLDNVALLLERMGTDEDNIAASFDELKDYIGSLGTWIMNTRNQPLELDYILFYSADNKEEDTTTVKYLKKNGYHAAAPFFSAVGYEFKQFVMSWISDYSSYGVRTAEGSEDYKSIEVWTTSGRDQAQIMRSLVSDSFTQQHNIAVEIKLVAAGSLLPATLSGSGPDVNLTLASSSVINYAIRSAILPINPEGYVDMEGDSEEQKAKNAEYREIFSDFDEVEAWFAPAATTPIQLYGVAYGLPETEHFSMLFYRSDILVELGLEIPETWDDVYNMLPTLQTNNLQFGYHESLAGLLIMLYQRGEQLYRPALENDPTGKTFGMQINLDSNSSLETFKDLCELYTMYGFPYSYNFVNRFRTGEMPAAVAQYTTYSQLTIYAPELRGLWGFTVLPGTINTREDGTTFIDHTADTTITATCMMRGCEEVEAAWTFMKWWVGAEAQGTYAQEYYALLGASGQYATANLEALYSMSWTAEERAELQNQFEWLQATPEMPGGYIVARYVEFAFLRAYNDDQDPVEAMLSYIDSINSEITRKRSEFGLPTLENYEEYIAQNA